MTSSWFFLSTLNYDARSTTHQICYLSLQHEEEWYSMIVFWSGAFLVERTFLILVQNINIPSPPFLPQTQHRTLQETKCLPFSCQYLRQLRLLYRRENLAVEFLGEFKKSTVSFFMSARLYFCPHGTTRLLLVGFSWTVIFEYFSKIRWEISSFVKNLTRITDT